jgi:dihydrofolate synthase/folylpolyglutamate synthase
MKMRLNSFADVTNALAAYMPEPGTLKAHYDLVRIRALMEHLGNPQDAYETIHIAGTSGKTSTSYYIAALLTEAGCKTGLMVSPHIDEVNERVQLNMVPLPEAKFCAALSEFLDILNTLSIELTYFELLVGFAYWYYAKIKVDYAVVEVGLGGLLDGTNVINRADKVCVITDIGIDHISVLGNTITEIASQKAGIILSHNEVIMYRQGDEVMKVVRDVCHQKQAVLHEQTARKPDEVAPDLPLFQQRNWNLARQTYELVAERDGLPKLSQERLVKTQHTFIPARMNIIHQNGKTIIMDGAHNQQKMQALVASLQHMFGTQEMAILFSLLSTKEARSIETLKEVSKLKGHIIFTGYQVAQHARHTSMDPAQLAAEYRTAGFDAIEVEPDPRMALEKLFRRPEPVLLITGSLYLLDLVRGFMRANKSLKKQM